ncbi:hypothetical protein SIN08_13965 [Chelativorans sp. M5D2P16]|nr:hypothetical protein [Chelativorans sp. M5D2P16]MDZ5698357.1 hypothetical protein [Chelativorans sp. M5D2P16]
MSDMKSNRRTSLWLALLVWGSAASVSTAYGQNWPEKPILLAQSDADCYAIGQRIAAENGGTLAKASTESSGGQTVCRIVVLVPGQGGERPRRREFTVPLQ